MRIESFSVQNYRSIAKTEKIELSSLTVLVGANNEGKSNLLDALSTCLDILASLEPDSSYSPGDIYEWERDFPIGLQKSTPGGSSVFTLLLNLETDEAASFRQEVGSKLKGLLPIEIRIDKRARPTFKVRMQGPGALAMSKKSSEIAEFVGSRLQVVHIPTIRSAAVAKERMERVVRRELLQVTKTVEYKAALMQITNLQGPILTALSRSVTETLQRFIPDVKKVALKTSPARLTGALAKLVDIEVDDGVLTSLDRKGDGIQSISTIAMIRHASEQATSKRSLVLTIEEPESHLHPNAIHQLKLVLNEISQNNQVVLTTHNPIFVNRTSLSSNILVSGNRARVARSVQQIRDALGVRAPDNLRSAELVLMVEGEDDAISMRRLIALHSTSLQKSMEEGRLAIDPLQGASHLVFKANFWRTDLFRLHAFLDFDKAGTDAFAEAENRGLLTVADVNFARAPGRNESELEDLVDIEVYATHIFTRWGVDLRGSRFSRDAKKKWSDRMSAAFAVAGKPWSEHIKSKVKLDVARIVEESHVPIKPNEIGPIAALFQTLEEKLR
jgi:putative ATP-dependent endonuclease of the OLD family